MKQLLIVNSAKALNATGATPYDLSKLEAGAISFWELGGTAALAKVPTKNFAIALGRGNNSPAFVIPEVDVKTLSITKSLPKAGVKFAATVTIATVTEDDTLTIVLVKGGTVPHERNTWTATEKVGKNDTAKAVVKRLYTYFNEQVKSGALNLTLTYVEDATSFTIAGNDYTQWGLKAGDDLAASTISVTATPVKPIGDKAYILDLASRCAAGKGFNLLSEDGKEIYPGYPEAVEDLTPNASGTDGASTAGYAVYNLHFATKRESGKQLNELVWQYVHIAVPITATAYSTINTILPEGDFSTNMISTAKS